jgi:hypothetical protein
LRADPKSKADCPAFSPTAPKIHADFRFTSFKPSGLTGTLAI